MKCYNHHTHDAFGICKHCQKGICMDCLVDTGSGLACKETCRDNVIFLNKLVDRQVRMYGSTNQSIKLRALFYIAFAAFFILMAFQVNDRLSLTIAFGSMVGLFLVMAIGAFRHQKKLQ